MKLPTLTPQEAVKFAQYLRYFKNAKKARETKSGMVPMRKYLTVPEAAKHFGISTRSLYRYRELKLIKFYKMRGRTLLKIKEIEAFISDWKQPVRI